MGFACGQKRREKIHTLINPLVSTCMVYIQHRSTLLIFKMHCLIIYMYLPVHFMCD